MKKNILFICTGNSVRSQMAHGLFNHLTNENHNVFSAGITPAGVHPLTQKVMADIGIDMTSHSSNHVDEMLTIEFDYVVVLCEVAFLSIPEFKGNYKLLKWFIDDPIRIRGSKERKLQGFTMTRDIVKRKVQKFIDEENLGS